MLFLCLYRRIMGCGEISHVAGAYRDFPWNPSGTCLCAFAGATDRCAWHLVGDPDRMDPGGQCGVVETVEVEKRIILAAGQGGILCIR